MLLNRSLLPTKFLVIISICLGGFSLGLSGAALVLQVDFHTPRVYLPLRLLGDCNMCRVRIGSTDGANPKEASHSCLIKLRNMAGHEAQGSLVGRALIQHERGPGLDLQHHMNYGIHVVVAHAKLELAVYARMLLNFLSSCVYFLRAGILEMQKTGNPRLCLCWVSHLVK